MEEHAWSPETLVRTTEMAARAGAYERRLMLATKLRGRAKLAVLRNVYRRMARHSDAITNDLKSRLLELDTLSPTYAEDPEMQGRIRIAKEQLEGMLRAWEDVAQPQHKANITTLERVLLPFES